MREIILEYQLLVFLYAYLHQIDLSLDRSRWVSLSELREYYKSQILPEKLAYFLIKKFNMQSNKLQNIYYIKDINFFSKLKGQFLRSFKKSSFLSENELYYCCQKLLTFDRFLKSDIEIHKLEIEKLRIEFAKLTYGNIKFKLSAEDRERVSKIEHYLQHEDHNSISIQEFLNDVKLE